MKLEHGTPEWWIARLWKRLDERSNRIQLYEDYYAGNHRLRFISVKAREVFGDQFSGFADNFCLLVVDAVEERLKVRGFRIGGASDTDDQAARIWAANDMDATSQLAHTEALVNEESYAIVWADPFDPQTPIITVESPFEVICITDQASRRRRQAALKRWWDEDEKRWRVVLYLPDVILKFISDPGSRRQMRVDNPGVWKPWETDGEPWPLPNPLGVVPVVPLVNMPRLGPDQTGTSELASVIPLQDALNKTAFDQLIASEFAAYPQRYMVGVTLPKDENDQPIEPFKAGVDRVWFIETEDGATLNPQVGQFPAASLDPYVNTINQYVTHIAAITKTPRHYLIDPGGGTNLSGETIKALEAGLVSKTRRKQRIFGESWEEVIAIALRLVDGGPMTAADDQRVEAEWFDPETRTESQHIDALVKLGSEPIGVPRQQLWRDAGYTEEQLRRFEEWGATGAPPPPVAPDGA